MRASCSIQGVPETKEKSFLDEKGEKIKDVVYELDADSLEDLARQAVLNILNVIACVEDPEGWDAKSIDKWLEKIKK